MHKSALKTISPRLTLLSLGLALLLSVAAGCKPMLRSASSA